jgi:hypothetical protein
VKCVSSFYRFVWKPKIKKKLKMRTREPFRHFKLECNNNKEDTKVDTWAQKMGRTSSSRQAEYFLLFLFYVLLTSVLIISCTLYRSSFSLALAQGLFLSYSSNFQMRIIHFLPAIDSRLITDKPIKPDSCSLWTNDLQFEAQILSWKLKWKESNASHVFI